MESILLSILAAVAPALTIYVVTQLLKLQAAIDELPGLIKQILTVVEAFALAKFGAFLGVSLPADLATFADPVYVQTALTTLLSWVIHKFFAPKTA